MARKTTVESAAATLAIAALLLGPLPAAADEAEAPAAKDRIVPPSEYVEDIETPGTTGGVEDEVDAADAQAEAATAEATSAPTDPGSRAAAIATDLIIGRPTMLMATIAGSALFALSLPITAPSGMYDEALERFVEEPGNRLIGPLGE
jgi:hypothetical protein